MSISVLLIDDEEVLRNLASTYIACTAPDITVNTAESASAALEKIKHLSFDAVVSDYEMPGMNGIELLKAMKSNGNGAPFILFTGRGREEIALEALNNGAAFYIQKGGDAKSQFTELIHKIRQAVRRERAERAAQETQQRMADVLNFLPDPTIAIDTKGTLIVWNKAAEDLTGVPAKNLLGKGDYEYALPFYGWRRPLLLDLVLHPDAGKLAEYYTVTKDTGDLIYAESRMTPRGGKVLILWIKATLLYDGDGDVTGAIETLRNITVRKQIAEENNSIRQNLLAKNEEIVQANRRLAEIQEDLRKKNEELGEAFEEMAVVEEELRHTFTELQESHRILSEREQDYRVLVESLTDAVVVHRDGQILYENPAALTLFGRVETLPDEFALLQFQFPDDCGGIVIDLSRKVMADGKVIPRHASRVIRPDGSEVSVEITLCPTRYKGESAVLAVLRDVTGRRKFEEEIRARTEDLERQAKALAQANRTITLMSAVTRHDILNQLSIVSSYISLAKQMTDNPVLLTYMNRQEAAAESIHRHILFTQDYNEIGMRDPGWQDLSAVFSRAAAGSGANSVRFAVGAADLEVYADHMLEKVFSNLIDNSLRHGEKVSEIRVSAVRKDDGSLLLSFTDDGIGIPDKDKTRIFERGYGKNTGLGMFLVKEILAITGIAISEDGEPGKGARFVMAVPAGAYRMRPPAR